MDRVESCLSSTDGLVGDETGRPLTQAVLIGRLIEQAAPVSYAVAAPATNILSRAVVRTLTPNSPAARVFSLPSESNR